MKFASRFADTTMLPIDFNPGTVNAVAYAVRGADNKVLVAILNKDATQDLTLTTPAAEILETLTGIALDRTETHLTTGGKSIKTNRAANGQTITIPAHTAVMLQLR